MSDSGIRERRLFPARSRQAARAIAFHHLRADRCGIRVSVARTATRISFLVPGSRRASGRAGAGRSQVANDAHPAVAAASANPDSTANSDVGVARGSGRRCRRRQRRKCAVANRMTASTSFGFMSKQPGGRLAFLDVPSPSPTLSAEDMFSQAMDVEATNPVAACELYRRAIAADPGPPGCVYQRRQAAARTGAIRRSRSNLSRRSRAVRTRCDAALQSRNPARGSEAS